MNALPDQIASEEQTAPDREPMPEQTIAEREAQIAIAAFYFAEARGFEPGHDLDDWLRAEEQIDAGHAGVH